MKYSAVLSKKVSKFLEKLSKKEYQFLINKLLSLEIDPYQSGMKKLRGV